MQFPAAGVAAPATVEDVRGVYEQAIGQEPAAVQTIGQGAAASVLIRSEPLDAGQIVTLRQALFDQLPAGRQRRAALRVRRSAITDVSGTWGGQITRQALIALAVFLVLVTIFLAFYFERGHGRRRAGRPRARRRGDGGRLLARRVRGHARHGDRPAHDPGLLALRHRRGVRQGQGEHARAARPHPPDLRRGGEPRAEPDADALDQHLADRGAAGAGPDGRRRRAARGRHARRPRARADRRHPGGRGVVGAAGDPASWSTSSSATPASASRRGGSPPAAPGWPRPRPGRPADPRATSRT